MKRPASLLEELRQTKPFASLEEEVYIGLRLTAQLVDEPWARHLRATADISPSQYNLLRILRGAGKQGRTMGEIAERMLNRDPDVTRLADRLVARGLARRERDGLDRRVVRLFISRAGLQLLAPLDQAVQVFVKQVMGSLGAGKLRQLGRLLAETRAGLRPFPPDGA